MEKNCTDEILCKKIRFIAAELAGSSNDRIIKLENGLRNISSIAVRFTLTPI